MAKKTVSTPRKRPSLKEKKTRSRFVYETLSKKYPHIDTFLTHKNPFELLIAVILSAQCTDERVNKVTPSLFKRFPTPKALGDATIEEVADSIKSINFFNNKAKNIQKTAQIIHKTYNNEVPKDLEKLTALPGVGRKTANVVLGQAFDIPGITVDTHVKRLCSRLGLTKETDPVKIEYDLMKCWPDETWNDLSSQLILFGRETCDARKPQCHHCELLSHCPHGSSLLS